MSTLVVLNGTSSSGKTTIARAFQDAAPTIYLNFSVDSILSGLPPSVLARMIGGLPVTGLRLAELIRSFYACTRELLRTGHDLVIDHAVTARYHAEELLAACEGHETLIVGIECPVPVTREREAARGDRRVGLAGQQFASIHVWLEYDLVVDTSKQSPSEAAASILAALASGGGEAIGRTRRKLQHA
ncbi:MAG: chloramphenicol phosphotransferase CPT family protein [Acidobacteria bacterium]|nr:chloramphenicol phosphotransferase CPT family protein [Acidobacteriota bacterium]